VHYDSERWNFGLTYRAEMSPDIEGQVEFTNIPDVDLGGGTNLQDLFITGPGRTTLDLPAQAGVGVAYKFSEAWTAEFDISWAGWSSFKEIALDFENNTPAVEDTVLREDWDDTQAFRLGVAWSVAEKHEVRFGALIDSSPVPTDTLRPSIPDADRKSVTFGYGFNATGWSLDAYYMPLWFDDITAQGSDVIDIGAGLPERVGEGVINGEYSTMTNLLGVTFNYRF
jgi:long-chain fatty acid transport protein